MGDARFAVESDRFGRIEVDADDIIELPDGLLGFPDVRRMVLLPVDDDATFCWMQAVDDPALAFLAVAPWSFFPDYELEITDDVAEDLGVRVPSDAVPWCLITVHRDPDRFTANLLGPIVVNRVARRARQVVLRRDLPTQAELQVA